MANGAFGQVRVIVDNTTNEEMAVKLENSNAKMPMLFLEYRFYKVKTFNKIFENRRTQLLQMAYINSLIIVYTLQLLGNRK